MWNGDSTDLKRLQLNLRSGVKSVLFRGEGIAAFLEKEDTLVDVARKMVAFRSDW